MAYFYFESRQNGSTVKLEKSNTGWTRPSEITLEISKDSNNWSAWTWDEPVTVKEGEALYIKGNNPDGFGDTYSYNQSRYHRFVTTGSFNISGDIRSLISSSNDSTIGCSHCFNRLFNGANIVEVSQDLLSGYTTLNDYCYYGMFSGCTSLTTAPTLPATTLAQYCYGNMFSGCTSLSTPPAVLPATTLAGHCYYYMFADCTSLTTAPTLPATTLAQYCYSNMFYNCSSLTTAPTLPATTLAQYCYSNMFYNCTSLTTAPSLPATTLASYCYQYMFRDCTSLTTAPELPATALAQYCYSNMFYGCTSLTTAPQLSATTLASYCYNYMFYGCTSLTTAPTTLPATTLSDHCYTNMFYGCTSLTTAPTLPATTLADNCYYFMFYNCSSLTTAPALPATTLAEGCYAFMFRGCTSLTTAPELPVTTLAYGCYRYMFEGCTALTTAPALPTTTLAEACYKNMFSGCTNLNYIKCLATDISVTDCTNNWVGNVANTGTFLKSPNMSSWTTGNNGIPSGWTVIDDAIPSITVTPDSFTGISYESASTERPTVDYVNIVISSVTATTTADWLDIDWVDDSTKTQLEIEIDDNTGETRTATITITGTDVFGGTQTATITIEQDANPASIRLPIWRDEYFTGSTTTLDYYILLDGNEVIYQGRAYVQPNETNVKINISRICENYLDNGIENGDIFLNGFVVHGENAIRTFELYDANTDNLLEEYRFVYDWSFEPLIKGVILTTPVNGHKDPRMIAVGTEVDMSLQEYTNLIMNNLYTSGYCGDYALYYLQRNGGWAAFLIEGNSKKTDTYERYVYSQVFDNRYAMFSENTYNNQITSEWEMHTGWLTKEQTQNFAFNLIASNRVFIHDLNNNKIIPAVITNSNAEYKTFKNNGNKLINYTITLRESQKKTIL